MGDVGLIKTGMLDIEYLHEEGTGVGPTLEFYSLLAKEIRKLEIWRNSEHEQGLFPGPFAH
jgi:E3 ubiquitin-protein ligase TRIP12